MKLQAGEPHGGKPLLCKQQRCLSHLGQYSGVGLGLAVKELLRVPFLGDSPSREMALLLFPLPLRDSLFFQDLAGRKIILLSSCLLRKPWEQPRLDPGEEGEGSTSHAVPIPQYQAIRLLAVLFSQPL